MSNCSYSKKSCSDIKFSFGKNFNRKPKLKSYIKQDWNFLKKLRRNLDPNFTFSTCDIVSLYTYIPQELGLRALLYYITKYRYLIRIRFSKEFILEVAEFVLKNNNFILLEEMFNQVMGTAMGTKFAPPYSNFSVGFLEETVLFPVELPKYFSHDNCKYIEELFKRYMDDGFLPWHSALDLNAFKNILNNLRPTIEFTVGSAKFDKFSKTLFINFLDITVLLHELVTQKRIYFTRKRTPMIIIIITVIIRTISSIIFPSIWQNVF